MASRWNTIWNIVHKSHDSNKKWKVHKMDTRIDVQPTDNQQSLIILLPITRTAHYTVYTLSKIVFCPFLWAVESVFDRVWPCTRANCVMNRLDPKLHRSLLSSVYTVCTRATLSFTATLDGSSGIWYQILICTSWLGGSAHDATVLADAIEREDGFTIPQGNCINKLLIIWFGINFGTSLTVDVPL
jgi:hypothetical protein